MSIIKKIYNAVLSVQTILLFMFLIQNINTLDSVNFAFSLNSSSNGFTLNMYSLLAVLAVIFTVIILAGLNIFSVGLNETSTANVAKYVAYLIFFALFNLTTAFYILPFGWVGLMFQILIVLVYFLRMVDGLGESNNVE